MRFVHGSARRNGALASAPAHMCCEQQLTAVASRQKNVCGIWINQIQCGTDLFQEKNAVCRCTVRSDVFCKTAFLKIVSRFSPLSFVVAY
jgi:hypothetical protein